jgi:type VI secretion system protein ImpK
MQEETANLVHPVLNYGLALRDRLEKGDTLNIEIEQSTLKSMLLSDVEALRWPEYGGETLRETRSRGDESPVETRFLGIRYALTCWLDELFILYSPWENAWTERKLEAALYGTNDRAWKFWDQARKADTRPNLDALEALFLCVMLGFRGEMIEAPDRLKDWVATTQARLAQQHLTDWQGPPELEPATNVPPLRARERLQRMVLAGGLTLLLLIPVVVFLVVRQMGQ